MQQYVFASMDNQSYMHVRDLDIALFKKLLPALENKQKHIEGDYKFFSGILKTEGLAITFFSKKILKDQKPNA